MLERKWSKGNPPTLLVRMEIGATTMENSMQGPQKIKNKDTQLETKKKKERNSHHMTQQVHF